MSRVSTATPIQPASEPPPPLVPREWRLRLDPLLVLAAARARRLLADRAQGRDGGRHPRPAVLLRRAPGRSTACVGLVLMYGVSRVDYSRLRELQVRRSTGFMIGSIVLVFGLATRDARLQALDRDAVLPLPAVRARQGAARASSLVGLHRRPHAPDGRRDTTARIMLLGAAAGHARHGPARPRAPRWSTSSARSRCCSSPGAPWRHFAALGALGAVAIALTLVALPTAGVEVLKPLPGGPPDLVPAPVRRGGRGGLPAAAVQDRDRLGREDRPRRGERHPDRR